MQHVELKPIEDLIVHLLLWLVWPNSIDME